MVARTGIRKDVPPASAPPEELGLLPPPSATWALPSCGFVSKGDPCDGIQPCASVSGGSGLNLVLSVLCSLLGSPEV